VRVFTPRVPSRHALSPRFPRLRHHPADLTRRIAASAASEGARAMRAELIHSHARRSVLIFVILTLRRAFPWSHVRMKTCAFTAWPIRFTYLMCELGVYIGANSKFVLFQVTYARNWRFLKIMFSPPCSGFLANVTLSFLQQIELTWATEFFWRCTLRPSDGDS
jgi:hypothetical protein